jgi:hypothetical protein
MYQLREKFISSPKQALRKRFGAEKKQTNSKTEVGYLFYCSNKMVLFLNTKSLSKEQTKRKQ